MKIGRYQVIDGKIKNEFTEDLSPTFGLISNTLNEII